MEFVNKLLARIMWRPIVTAPRGRKVLVTYTPYHRPLVTVAKFYPDGTLEAGDDYETESGFAPEGWYEEAFENENLMMLTRDPTHWRSLPKAQMENASDRCHNHNSRDSHNCGFHCLRDPHPAATAILTDDG